jgi:hypothetical protein
MPAQVVLRCATCNWFNHLHRNRSGTTIVSIFHVTQDLNSWAISQCSFVFNLLFEKFLPPGALWAIYQVSLYVLIL